MRTGQTKKRTLAAALCLLLAAVLLTVAGRRQEPASDSGVKLRAAQQMASCMERILSYKAELSLALSPEDLHGSGLIGDSFTGITTTIGAIEAKRTVSDANMAALMVQRALGT